MISPIRDRIVVILSLAIQFPLALLFGHYYDDRIFLATGYLVANGQNPYQAQDLSAVFHSSIFQGITTIGYPPPWALVLGMMYRVANSISANLFVYNFAIKLPIIAANIGIAYLVGAMLARLGADESVSRKARVLLLLNPFLFYFGTAWGQFDAIVAVFSLIAIMLLENQKPGWSALALALAVSFKPTAIPILCVFLIYWMGKSFWRAVRFLAFFMAGIILFCILPFPVFGWDPTPILAHWNFHFTVAGGMSPMTIYSLFNNSGQLAGVWGLLGWVWIPALVLGMFAVRSRIRGMEDIIRASAAMVLIFLLTRSWLSEPNVILIVPLAVMLASVGRIGPRALAAVWILPFVFTALNNSIPQLLFPILLGSMPTLMQSNGEFRTVQLAAQIVIIVLWQIAGWMIVARCLPRKPEQ
jgi:hypothetical protein